MRKTRRYAFGKGIKFGLRQTIVLDQFGGFDPEITHQCLNDPPAQMVFGAEGMALGDRQTPGAHIGLIF